MIRTFGMAILAGSWLLLASSNSAHAWHEGHIIQSQHTLAAPQSQLTPIKTGTGSYQFVTTPEFFKTPKDGPGTGATHGGVVVDKQGRIYLTTDDATSAILVFKPDGAYLKSIAPQFVGSHSIQIRDEDGQQFLYVSHLAGKRVAKLTLDGEPVWTIGFTQVQADSGKYPEGNGNFKPTAVTIAPDGSIFIADGYGKSFIHQYDANRKYVRTFGGKGKENGKFQTCHGIAVDHRYDPPRLLICDRENRRVQHYDLNGNYIATIAENLRRPCSVAFSGDLVAIAELEARVTLLDGDNKEVEHLGSNPNKSLWAKFAVPPSEWKPGIFTAPHGCGFDNDGNLLVTDWNQTGRITRLKRVEE